MAVMACVARRVSHARWIVLDMVACVGSVARPSHARRIVQRIVDRVLRDRGHVAFGHAFGAGCRSIEFRGQRVAHRIVAVAFDSAAICGRDWLAPFVGARGIVQRNLARAWFDQ